MSEWKLLSEFVRVGSNWVTLIGERWLGESGNELEYWRVEKADSVIVLPIQAGQIFCAKPTFRVGIQRSTLDFPGGRLPEGRQPKEIVPVILERELRIPRSAIRSTVAINKTKWIINSAFSNQALWGFVVEIDEGFTVPESCTGAVVRADDSGVSDLLSRLDCLQCRTLLLEWFRQKEQA